MLLDHTPRGAWIDTYEPGEVGWRDRLAAKAEYIARSLDQAGQAYETDLCVVTALATPELDAVRALESWKFGAAESLDQVSYMYRGEFTVGNRTFSVTVAAAPRMGMVATATLTQKMIHRVRPPLIAIRDLRRGPRYVSSGRCAGGRSKLGLANGQVSQRDVRSRPRPNPGAA